MVIKYRVHEVAKDLGVPSKDVIDFLGQYYEEPRKHMTALSEEELNLIFEHYTKDKAVDNFDAYFAANTAPASASTPASTSTVYACGKCACTCREKRCACRRKGCKCGSCAGGG